ncbi:MAG: hypothetical protein AVDCRST_MAG31-895 [uncultured Sphingomonas sp.]|uniref:Flagellar hook-length control protein-like C-terminal domain-containing protein n=1 Tax=uncultured Sphingomonas sp. TaxID=158754 RepID=A0A6J4T1B5_9SPHN|nr:flagellar hook-length control protein FliK [uncultured Sphingomonas sp.]CAA9511039.1 MAG: hypothetical protein AVDCRST_MAG31-895 [uncultured Sphingomonas sp.]
MQLPSAPLLPSGTAQPSPTGQVAAFIPTASTSIGDPEAVLEVRPEAAGSGEQAAGELAAEIEVDELGSQVGEPAESIAETAPAASPPAAAVELTPPPPMQLGRDPAKHGSTAAEAPATGVHTEPSPPPPLSRAEPSPLSLPASALANGPATDAAVSAFAAQAQLEAPAPPAAQTLVVPGAPTLGSAAAARGQSSSTAGSARLALGGDFTERLGAVITTQLRDGGNEVQIRMDPAELGRIHVRLSFDEGGSLRAVVGADSPQVLDAMRRDAGELGRTLAEAGVRTDAQSFRFDRGSHGGGGGDLPRPWRHGQGEGREQSAPQADEPRYRPLRSTGRIDLMA